MRHPCNLCSLQFATEKILEKHVASFHIKPDASRSQPVLPVVLEKIKIEPELIRLDEEDDADDQTTITAQKQPPKAILEKTAIPQMVKRLRPKDCYRCEVCLETFSLLRYFRKHLAISETHGFFKCQEYYKTNINNGYMSVCNKPCLEGIDTAKDGHTTKKQPSQSRKRTTSVSTQTCEYSKDDDYVMMNSNIGNRNNKQRYNLIEKHWLSNNVDNNISFQRRPQSYVEFIQAAKCAAKAVNDENSAENIVILHKKQSKSSTGNVEVEMPVLTPPEILPTPQGTSCKECHLTCASYEQLCIHYSNDHNLPVVVLNHVDKHELLYRKYKQHVESIGTNNCFKCDTSGKLNFSFNSQICNKCNTCKRQFSSPAMLRKPKLAVHNEKEVRRNNVKLRQGKLISTPKIRKRVGQVNHTKSHQCNVCQQEFSTQLQLTRHKVTAHQQDPLECDLCQKKYSNKYILTFHKLTVHEKVRFKCELCQRDFSTRPYLKQHQRAAHEGFRHKCEICLKEFEQLRILKQHKQIYHSDIRLKCELCPKEFALLSKLRNHKLIAHDGVRQKCEICLKEFKRMNALKQHKLAAHDGVRHKCKSCPKTFSQLGDLNQHKRSVHDRVRYKCESCPKSFSRLKILCQHKRAVHDGFVIRVTYAKKISTRLNI